jgi:hypothetical protein
VSEFHLPKVRLVVDKRQQPRELYVNGENLPVHAMHFTWEAGERATVSLVLYVDDIEIEKLA